jgi:acetyltransferase-like isoleucine patch superfamily enzyme
MTHSGLYPIAPGGRIEGDWNPEAMPLNIQVGDNSVCDSSFCFREYKARDRVGLIIGSNVTLFRMTLSVQPNATLVIGDHCHLSLAQLVCSDSIQLGDGVFMGLGTVVVDSDFHPLEPAARLGDTVAISPLGDPDRRPRIETAPVIIEDDVWIGHKVTILKGVRVGRGAVIQPGALITRDVPAGAVMQGNPARPLAGTDDR